MGNQALALGLLTASHNNDIDLFYGGYPITPASELLHYLANYKSFGVKTFQAEDEIAGITSAIGAAFAGNLAVTASSGPGIALKGEAIGLAMITELPIIIINIQRGGPSTGLPTKTEQSDLLQAMYGRNGECPCVILAASRPSDCFDMAYEASRIALEHMIPVILLSDGYIANGSEPWRFPNVKNLPKFDLNFVNDGDEFYPYDRNDKTLARKWAIPGNKNYEHRIGGLEKADVTGNVSYDADNHHKMTLKRQEKVDIISNFIPDVEVHGPSSGKLLVIGWGGTYGSIKSAITKAHKEDLSVSQIHLNYINPFPNNLGELLLKFDKILIPELNMGQLLSVIRSKYLVDAKGYNSIKGKPFSSNEILEVIKTHLKD